jgi:hypothetical protein
MGELAIAAVLCAFLDGSVTEEKQYFDVNGMSRHVRVDCETATHVIEVGLDGTDSARDSLHQALFFAHLTGKIPVVVMIDRDGFEGRFEYEMRHTTAMAGVAYARCTEDFILRWGATAGLRPSVGDDLPKLKAAEAKCNLGAVLRDAPSGAS